MTLIYQVLGAFIGVYFTTYLLDAPRKYSFVTGLIGASGWLLYLLIVAHTGTLTANYLSGLLIAFCAHLVARFGKTPVTVILIPSFYPLVPGVGMHKTILYLIQGRESLFRENLKLTILIAVMIALSILTVDSIVYSFFRVKKDLKKRFWH